jgi:hypothetical protein
VLLNLPTIAPRHMDARQVIAPDPVDGLTAEEVVRREKRREDALRDVGYEVARSVWADLGEPAVIVDRYKRCFARAANRCAVMI